MPIVGHKYVPKNEQSKNIVAGFTTSFNTSFRAFVVNTDMELLMT